LHRTPARTETAPRRPPPMLHRFSRVMPAPDYCGGIKAAPMRDDHCIMSRQKGPIAAIKAVSKMIAAVGDITKRRFSVEG